MSKEEKIIEMKQKGDLNGLVKIIKNDTEWMFRMDAAKALSQLGDKRGLNYLIHALDDSDQDVRGVAREILEELNDPRGNQALLQSRKPVTVHSEHNNSSENLGAPERKITKEARTLNKRKERNDKSFSQTAIIIIAIAGILIFIDSFTWSAGGMNGLISMVVVVLAVLVLGFMSLGRVAVNLLQSKETKIDGSQPGKNRKEKEATTNRKIQPHVMGLLAFMIIFAIVVIAFTLTQFWALR